MVPLLDFTILIPAKNEAESLEPLISSIFTEMTQAKKSFEILVINDNSTDETENILEQYHEKYPNLRYITIPPKLPAPVGTAIRLGIKKANGNFIITMDGDGSHEPKSLKDFISQKQNGKIAVIGGRYLTSQRPFQPLTRYYISKTFNFLAKMFLGRKIFDLTSGYRLFSKKVGADLKSSDFELHIELNLKISRLPSEKIAEIPINYKKRKFGKSKLKYLRVLPRYTIVVFREFLSKLRNKNLYFLPVWATHKKFNDNSDHFNPIF